MIQREWHVLRSPKYVYKRGREQRPVWLWGHQAKRDTKRRKAGDLFLFLFLFLFFYRKTDISIHRLLQVSLGLQSRLSRFGGPSVTFWAESCLASLNLVFFFCFCFFVCFFESLYYWPQQIQGKVLKHELPVWVLGDEGTIQGPGGEVVVVVAGVEVEYAWRFLGGGRRRDQPGTRKQWHTGLSRWLAQWWEHTQTTRLGSRVCLLLALFLLFWRTRKTEFMPSC